MVLADEFVRLFRAQRGIIAQDMIYAPREN
jgi:hypothetical protein